jgi:hypothetical protein
MSFYKVHFEGWRYRKQIESKNLMNSSQKCARMKRQPIEDDQVLFLFKHRDRTTASQSDGGSPHESFAEALFYKNCFLPSFF